MSERVVVVGGFASGRRVLELVADVLCRRYSLGDADIFTFPGAMQNTTRLERAVRGRPAFTHSAGLLAVAACAGVSKIAALNPPEPRSVPELLGRAVRRSGHLWEQSTVGPRRGGAARVIATNTIQGALHPAVHLGQLRAVSTFSATDVLSVMHTHGGIRTARIDTEDDELFGPYPLKPWDGVTAVLPGVHDQILIHPPSFVAALPEDLLAR